MTECTISELEQVEGGNPLIAGAIIVGVCVFLAGVYVGVVTYNSAHQPDVIYRDGFEER